VSERDAIVAVVLVNLNFLVAVTVADVSAAEVIVPVAVWVKVSTVVVNPPARTTQVPFKTPLPFVLPASTKESPVVRP
jgi:hypothetical protein